MQKILTWPYTRVKFKFVNSPKFFVGFKSSDMCAQFGIPIEVSNLVRDHRGKGNHRRQDKVYLYEELKENKGASRVKWG